MLRIITGNHQELLLELLAQRLRMPVGSNPLTPEVLVTERGIDRWVLQQLARRHGIAANIDCQLPATFLWKTLRALTPATHGHDGKDFDNGIVAWRLMRLLPPLLATPDFGGLRRYLSPPGDARRAGSPGNIDGRRLYQLCRRIAAVFDGYLVYRPQLVLHWEAGRDDPQHGENGRWQRRLWQALAADARGEHRVALMQRFCAADDEGNIRVGDDVPRRVAIFGIPALPPAFVDIIARIGKHIDIDLYVLSPSEEFWGDLLAPAALRHMEQQTGFSFDIANRLLAANAQPLRHFLAGLAGQAGDHIECFAAPAGQHLLARLQADILALRETSGLDVADIDDSIQLVSAYGPMREVEILHDNLLAMFNADPTLAPDDVLVLAPDILAYAPCIEAVFGAATGNRHIPYSIADVPLRGTHPIAVACEALLHLPDSRLTVNEVLALLETPAVAARWHLDEGDLERVRSALQDANVRWGLDAAARAREGLPAEYRHTWQFAFDRLFMGIAIDDDNDTVLGIASCPAFTGQDAETLGRLRDFVDTLAGWQKRLGTARTASEWADLITALLETFFASNDSDGDRVIDEIAAAARALRDEAEVARYTAAMDTTTFRDDFLARLDDAPARGGFLSGAVTCARLLPMRSLPFRVIALLGMDATAFPRRQPKTGFDLVDLFPQAGDRARRLDDRHLFLEMLLSAGDRLYISWSGRSPLDDTPREPSVLAGELVDAIVAMHGGEDARQRVRDRLVTQHPLQPFSKHYFDGSSPRLFSHDEDWLRTARTRDATGEPWQFCAAPLPAPDNLAPVSLPALLRFMAHPVRSFLRERLGVTPATGDEALADDEPFFVDGKDAWRLGETWLAARIEGRTDNEVRTLLAARGELPAGIFGSAALDARAGIVHALHEQVSALLHAPADLRISLQVPTPAGTRLLTGVLRNVTGSGLLRWSTAKTSGKHVLALWIEHLALCAQRHENADGGAPPVSRLLSADGTWEFAPVAAAQALALLADLLAIRDSGLCEPLPLFARTSWAYASDRKRPVAAALTTWRGDEHGSGMAGEREDPAHRIAFDGIDDIFRDIPGDRFASLAMRLYEPLLAATQATSVTAEAADADDRRVEP